LVQDRDQYRDFSRRAIVCIEEKRERAYAAARERRHNPPTPADALQCPHCGKMCRGRVGVYLNFK